MTRRNLCPNPACGANTTGWGGSATFTRSTSLTGMPRSTGVAVTGGGFVQTPTGAVTAGQVSTVSFYIKNNTGSNIASGKQVFIAYTRSVGGDTFPESFNTAALGVDGTVTRGSFTTAAAPADATGIYLIIDQLVVGVEVTAVLYELGSTLGAYFDGDSASASWDGTPNNSTSTLVDVTGATPNGIPIPVGLGSPVAALGRTAAPNGLAAALALGTPSVSVNRSAAPAGLAIPVALGFSDHGPIPGILTPSGRPAATLTAAGATPTLTAS